MSGELQDKYQQLLRDLKRTVEGLLVSQVSNVWCIYGGLNRLHNDVEKIFRHGCKVYNKKGTIDYWQFIQGLEWLQPDNSKSTLSIDTEYKNHIPQFMKNDLGSLWIYCSLENHSLSQKLLWLLSDKTHVLSCYQNQAFLNQDKYTEAMLICLRAVERNQPSLISEIEPSLFLSTFAKDFHKAHRRCSSFPDAHLKMLSENSVARSKTMHNMTDSVSEDQETTKLEKRTIIQGKLKAWNSMPILGIQGFKLIDKKPATVYCHTTPTTPVHHRYTMKDQTDSNLFLTVDKKPQRQEKNQEIKPLVFDNNIIEHTPHPHSSTKMQNKLKSKSSKTSTKSSPDFGFLDVISGVAGQKDYKKQPKKSFIEDGGMSVLPMSTGYFPRPTKGQTLTDFLQSSQFARANAELDRENAHFSISEAMIAAMEQLRCRRDLKLVDEQAEESDEEIMDLKQRIRTRRRQKLEEKQKHMWGVIGDVNISDSAAGTNIHSPYLTSASSGTYSSEEIEDLEIDEAASLDDKRGLSMSMASLYSEADLLRRPRGAPDGASDILSAESVALSLISKFNEKHLPRASELEWLVSEEDAPQALLPLPKSWPVNPDENDEIPVTPLRGTKEWAPPRPQIIFTLHKPPKKKEMLLKQNYRCAGCGFRVEKKYSNTFRYCNYLGRYFCTQCHTNQVALIPARILQKWNFTKCTVSTFSYRLLEQMYADPLFRVFDLNKNIGKYSKNLVLCKKYRYGLMLMKDYINICRYAEMVQDCLKSELSLSGDPEIYSIQDLVSIQSGEMKNKLKYLAELCCRHTSECELCLARGFICEICKNDQILFPWQGRIVVRCEGCFTCYHKECWNPDMKCFRCERLSKKKCGL